MLVRQIAMVRGLGVTFLRRIDDAVLLHQHDEVTDQQPHEFEQRGMRREPQEGGVIDERTPRGEAVADLFEAIAAEFLRLPPKDFVKTRAEIGGVAVAEGALQHRAAGEPNALGVCGQVGARGFLFPDAVAPQRIDHA